MKFQKSIIDLVKERTSTRTYDKREIDKASIQNLCDYLYEINASAKIKARFLFISTYENQQNSKTAENKSDDSGEKLGTYGMISGAQSYIVGILDKDEKDVVTFGYLFEEIVLFLTDIGLQTCWLGGTFNRDDFKKMMTLNDNEFMAIISPVGYKKDKQRIAEIAIRKAIGANKRKPWDQLFFNMTNEVPLEKKIAGEYSTPLEMVRLAPSASNKQPWRVINNESGYHFFLSRTKGYGLPGFDVQKNDIGIAMCHFELSAIESGLNGCWVYDRDAATPDEWEYIATWKV